MENFGIFAWPAYATKAGNPYNYLIYNNIEKEGYPVYDFEVDLMNIIKSGFSSKYKILHLHWPTNVLSAPSEFQAKRRLITFHLFLKLLKLLNKKIVWTVHNLEAHEAQYPSLQKQLSQILYKYVDGFISLNQTGLEHIKGRAKNSATQKFIHIPHPHYKGYYSNNICREKAREQLGIPSDKFVFLFLGQIRKYKNVTGLIDAFNQLDHPDKLLLIAGNVHHEIEQELKARINNADNIKLFDSFVNDEDLQIFMNSTDLVVTPYTQIFNSGSVFLNLSFNKPTLAPDLWALTELKNMVGSYWIKTYNGQLSADVLHKAITEVKAAPTKQQQPNINALSPELISRQTLTFYQDLF